MSDPAQPGESIRRLLTIPPAEPAPAHVNPPDFDPAQWLADRVRRDAAQRREGTIRTYTQAGISYAEPIPVTPPIPPEK